MRYKNISEVKKRISLTDFTVFKFCKPWGRNGIVQTHLWWLASSVLFLSSHALYALYEHCKLFQWAEWHSRDSRTDWHSCLSWVTTDSAVRRVERQERRSPALITVHSKLLISRTAVAVSLIAKVSAVAIIISFHLWQYGQSFWIFVTKGWRQISTWIISIYRERTLPKSHLKKKTWSNQLTVSPTHRQWCVRFWIHF